MIRASLAIVVAAAVTARAQVTVPLEWTGSGKVFGVEGPARVVVTPAGGVLIGIEGDVRVRRCLDGASAWSDDLGTPAATLHFTERDRLAVFGAVLSGTWDDSGSPLQLVFAEGTWSFTMSGSPLRGTIHADSGGPVSKFTIESGEGTSTTTMTGWHEVEGGWMPTEIATVSPQAGDMTISLSASSKAGSDAMRRPGADAAAARFAANIPPALEVKRAKTGHLLVKPVINGKECGWFIFDTGAGATVLDKTTAERLGVRQFGEIGVGGIGAATTSPLSQPETFTLGPATLERPTFITLDLKAIGAALGEDLAGVAGYDLLSRVVTVLDSEAGTISLFDPASFAGEEPWQRMYIYERHACLDATVEGHGGVFKLDTGSNTAVSMHGPAVERFKMLEGREVKEARIGGSGGFRQAKRGKLSNVVLGGREYTNVDAIFSTPSQDAFSDPSTLGNIGGPLLKDFVLVLDYPHERLALRPKAATKAP
ncbi:MAG: aspartyl protease family protein [Phycisphaerales bacterium]